MLQVPTLSVIGSYTVKKDLTGCLNYVRFVEGLFPNDDNNYHDNQVFD